MHFIPFRTTPLCCTHLLALQLILLGEDGHTGSQVFQLLLPGLWEEGTPSGQLIPAPFPPTTPAALGVGRAVVEEPPLLPTFRPRISWGRVASYEGRSRNCTIGGWVGVVAADVAVLACGFTEKCWRMFGCTRQRVCDLTERCLF